MFNLPTEIKDKIFLYLTYTDLKNSREWQSDYVKQTTRSFNMIDAINNKNDAINNKNDAKSKDNINWILSKYTKYGKYEKFMKLDTPELINHISLIDQICILETRYPLTVKTFHDTVRSGNLVDIQWLFERGCPWHKNTLKLNLYPKNHEISIWMKNNIKK